MEATINPGAKAVLCPLILNSRGPGDFFPGLQPAVLFIRLPAGYLSPPKCPEQSIPLPVKSTPFSFSGVAHVKSLGAILDPSFFHTPHGAYEKMLCLYLLWTFLTTPGTATEAHPISLLASYHSLFPLLPCSLTGHSTEQPVLLLHNGAKKPRGSPPHSGS